MVGFDRILAIFKKDYIEVLCGIYEWQKTRITVIFKDIQNYRVVSIVYDFVKILEIFLYENALSGTRSYQYGKNANM